MKSKRNKTIDMTPEQGGKYLERCISISEAASPERIENRTIIGDCMSVMPLLPDAFADLVIADPPYNMNKSFGQGSFHKISDEEYLEYTRAWLGQVRRLMKPDASIYICCDWRCSNIIAQALSESFIIRNRITWQREKGRGAAKNWKNSMEDIWFATVGEDYTFNLDAVKLRRKVLAPYRENGKPKDWEQGEDGKYRSTCPGNFWDDITVPYWSMPENTAHPTQKPEKLLAKLILASSSEGGMVFDPFLGSGSSAVTAKKLSRRWCGIEREEQFCLWAELRLETAEKDRSIQGFENGVFLARNSR